MDALCQPTSTNDNILTHAECQLLYKTHFDNKDYYSMSRLIEISILTTVHAVLTCNQISVQEHPLSDPDVWGSSKSRENNEHLTRAQIIIKLICQFIKKKVIDKNLLIFSPYQTKKPPKNVRFRLLISENLQIFSVVDCNIVKKKNKV